MELFALDLGNKQTKLKSAKAEYVWPSQILNRADQPQQLSSFKTNDHLHDFNVPFDPNTWAWGPDLASLRLDDYLQDTLMHQDRYINDAFKLLANFALGVLAQDFPVAKKEILEVIVVAGVPTDDYQSQAQRDALGAVLKGQHQVELDGQTYTIRVTKVLIIPQPVGTFYELLLDDQANVVRDELLDEKVGIVDVGGGTVLVDTLLNFGLDLRDRRQYATGANDLYEAIASQIEGSVSLYQVEKLVRTGLPTHEFAYQFSKNHVVDVTALVAKEITNFSQRLVRNLKSTFKDIQTIDTLIMTGGAANLIDQKVITDFFETALFLPDSELANVRGFYKYGLTKLEGESHG